MESNLSFDRSYNSWRGGGVFIRGAWPGTVARLFIHGDPIGCAVVDYAGRAQFFRGSPVLQTEGAVICINQPGLIASPIFEGLNQPIPDSSRVPVHIYSQIRESTPGPKCRNEIMYVNDPYGSYGTRRWSGGDKTRILMSRL
jgi:hypothetical protein